MAKMSKEEVLRHLGASPERVGAAITAFSEAAKVLSSDHPRLIDAHPGQWVGVFDGVVVGAEADFDTLMTKLREKGVPPSQTIVRFIEKTEKIFVI
jgi:hypothetical protein